MQSLQFHTVELPHLEEVGYRLVVIAHYGRWRDGIVTNTPESVPELMRELRKRFMQRYDITAASSNQLKQF